VIEVRAARPPDALAVGELHVRSWQQGYRGLVDQNHLDGLRANDKAMASAFERMTPAGRFTQVAVDGETICGMVTTGPARDPEPNVGGVWALYVDPPQWGTGAGRALLTAACALLREDNDEAVLWVADGNVRACRFYERNGWALDGACDTMLIGATPVDTVRYRRALAD
jgi:GNAT superfamily N-acetyltransferase